MKTSIAILTLLLASSSLTQAQTVSKAETTTGTLTIQAIDSATRTLTLRDEKGIEDSFTVGPAVARFNELKVGDRVKATYYESLVFQLRKPGEKANPASDEAAWNRAKSALPGGTVATQQKRTVTVTAVDPTVPSITVETGAGRVITRRVENKNNLEGVKAGDRIDITYTQALLTSVERAQ